MESDVKKSVKDQMRSEERIKTQKKNKDNEMRLIQSHTIPVQMEKDIKLYNFK
ncbi:hypothetical protein [Sulfurisphaera javensis]|uniref:hypothetical protein n=1 Tax=Sulfurisphaera javensis TaxID=2049879 RepID=UPI0034E8F3E4